jgi:uncharacterized membrane protein YbhN (UPF0104 family)
MTLKRTRLAWVAVLSLTVVIVGLFIARNIASWRATLSPFEVDLRFAGLAAVCMLGLVLSYAVAWWLLLRALGDRTNAWTTMRLFLLAWPGRYAPASLPFYGGRLAMADAIGSSRETVAASLVYENLFAIAASGSLAILLLGVRLRDQAGSLWVGLAVAGSLAALASLQPPVVRFIVRHVARRVSRFAAIERRVVSGTECVQLFAVYVAGSICSGLAFYFAVCAVSPHDHVPVIVAIGAYNLAGVAGMLAIAVPSGLGVREAVAIALTSSVLPPEVALAAVVLVRLAGVVADFTPFGILAASGAMRRLSAMFRSRRDAGNVVLVTEVRRR